MPNEQTRAVYRRVERWDPVTGAVQLGDPFTAMRDGTELLAAGDGPGGFGGAYGVEEAKFLVRCKADGTPVTPMVAPLHIQLGALLANDSLDEGSVDGHVADLKALREVVGDPAAEGVPEDMRAQAHLYDVTLAAPRDAVLPQHAYAAWAEQEAAKPQGVDPVIRKIEEGTRIDEANWKKVTSLGAHANEQIRALAREMLTPVLGNSAHLEDLRVLRMEHHEVERYNAVRRWVRESGDVRELPPFSSRLIPGYRSTEAMLAERDGVTMLMFGDFMGTYAYAWQTDPDNAPRINQEPEEKPYPFNMLG